MQNKITNKDYIEITADGADGVAVGGKSTTTYRGKKIWWLKNLSNEFEKIQQIVQREYGAAPIAMRVMSSETNGEYAKPGNPSPKHGKNAWVSFVFANGIETRWVFDDSHSSASDCAAHCAAFCGNSVRLYSGFRSGVFGPHVDAIKKLANKPQQLEYAAANMYNINGTTQIEINLDKQKLQNQINIIIKLNGKTL